MLERAKGNFWWLKCADGEPQKHPLHSKFCNKCASFKPKLECTGKTTGSRK